MLNFYAPVGDALSHGATGQQPTPSPQPAHRSGRAGGSAPPRSGRQLVQTAPPQVNPLITSAESSEIPSNRTIWEAVCCCGQWPHRNPFLLPYHRRVLFGHGRPSLPARRVRLLIRVGAAEPWPRSGVGLGIRSQPDVVMDAVKYCPIWI